MKNIKLAALALTLIFATSCKKNKKEAIEETEVEEVVKGTSTEKMLTVNLSPKSDSKVEGVVTFKENDGVVTMTAKMTGLTEGTHAIHIHEKADCSSPDGKSSGGHWNPTGQPHGKWGVDTGYHKGDIGNFKVATDGEGIVTLATDEWCIGCGDDTKDITGKAVVVHQGTDDFTSQPSGAAGARVSCAGIIE
ncbi:Copper-Zinc superoxide dismutase [Flavobacteriales bacterium ALC-1]|nr:Copper-Zinc superoxide dismutase [Flavobacteriales bacterium ALC-1]